MDSAALQNQHPIWERFYTEAPYFPRCSDDKTAKRVRPREHAIKQPYMQVNPKNMVSWLIFDLDHPNSYIWEDEGLPSPNIIVSDPNSGKSHLYYAIAPVCTSENARYAPINFMKRVSEALCAGLQGDPSYSGPVAKTPSHPWWKTTYLHAEIYSLGELADCLALPEANPFSAGPDLEANEHSRHCLLFEQTRFYAYSIVNRERETGSYSNFLKLVSAYAFNANNFRRRGFTMNLTASQVQATVKSISRWTWEKYQGSARSIHRGVMNLAANKGLSLRDKQKLAAKRTHKQRHTRTISLISSAIHRLQKEGKKVTYTALAAYTTLARQTVSKYSNVIEEVMNNTTKIISLGGLLTSAQNVNYGAHQIPAAPPESPSNAVPHSPLGVIEDNSKPPDKS